MKIGIGSPYFESLAGGERYLLTLASHLSLRHSVSVFWDDPAMIPDAERRFSLDLTHVKCVRNIWRLPLPVKLWLTRAYDLIVYLSDGSIPWSMARRNILHFQVPFARLGYPEMKLKRYQAIVCNSRFTRNHLDPRYGRKAHIIYPPVDTAAFTPGKKEKLILTVGRFSAQYQAKKQEILIGAWNRGRREGHFRDWKFVIAGGLLDGDRRYYEGLIREAEDDSIRFVPNCPFTELADLYGRASVYWHAAGYGESSPANTEHFGISTVEAMAAGGIPVVFDGGGLPEIVRHGINGYVWKTETELIALTEAAVKDRERADMLRGNAMKDSQKFGRARFEHDFDSLIAALI